MALEPALTHGDAGGVTLAVAVAFPSVKMCETKGSPLLMQFGAEMNPLTVAFAELDPLKKLPRFQQLAQRSSQQMLSPNFDVPWTPLGWSIARMAKLQIS